jgi:hypothetical protein
MKWISWIVVCICLNGEGMEVGLFEHYSWKNITRITSSEVETNENASSYAYGGSATVNWNEVKLSAECGDPVSQYCIGCYLWNKAPSLFNGERKRCYEVGAMFLLVSAFRGDFWKSREEVSSILNALELVPDGSSSVEVLCNYADQISAYLSK